MDVSKATEQIRLLTIYFNNMRNPDESVSPKPYEELYAAAVDIANELEIDAEFPLADEVRARRRVSQFDYEGRDDPIRDPAEKFRIEFFNHVHDVTINQLDERFKALQHLDKHYGFLYRINEASFRPTEQQCLLLEKVLSDPATNVSDISGKELLKEIFLYTTTRSNESRDISNPLDLLNYLAKKGFLEIFPNLAIALRILITIPVGVAAAERSFSKLKLIKNYLRNSMADSRLSHLALISIEEDCLSDVSQADIVGLFAAMRARKVDLSA